MTLARSPARPRSPAHVSAHTVVSIAVKSVKRVKPQDGRGVNRAVFTPRVSNPSNAPPVSDTEVTGTGGDLGLKTIRDHIEEIVAADESSCSRSEDTPFSSVIASA